MKTVSVEVLNCNVHTAMAESESKSPLILTCGVCRMPTESMQHAGLYLIAIFFLQ